MVSRIARYPTLFFSFVTLLLVTFALAFAWMSPSSASAADTIGTVAKKRLDVYGTPPDSDRKRLFPRYDITYGELIETSGGGGVLMRLDDGTELYLGERASLTIDDFVYDPQTNTGKAVYEFTVGTLRYVSGQMDETEISILTPNANIGIRGSEAIIFVTPKGDTVVNVVAGLFSVKSRARPDLPEVTVGPNENVSLSGAADFSQIGVGLSLPANYSHDPADKEPDYSDDYYDLKQGGGLDRAREGSDAGGRSGDGHDDGGGHHDAPD